MNPDTTKPIEPPIQEVEPDSGYVIPQNFAPDMSAEPKTEGKGE